MHKLYTLFYLLLLFEGLFRCSNKFKYNCNKIIFLSFIYSTYFTTKKIVRFMLCNIDSYMNIYTNNLENKEI